MKALLEWCLRWRLLVLAFFVLLVTLGLRAALELPIDAVPDTTNEQVMVLTQASSLGPLEIEQLITAPIENAMKGLPKMTELRSLSHSGLSALTVVFEEDVDLHWARQLISERLQGLRDELPEGVSPELGPMSSGLGEVFQFEITTDRPCAQDGPQDGAKDAAKYAEEDAEEDRGCHSLMDLRTTIDWFLARELRGVKGVVEVNVFGGELKTYALVLSPERLWAHGVSLSEVFSALEKNNATVGGGYVEKSGEQIFIRGEGRIASLEELGQVVVATKGGVPILVRDLGELSHAPMIRHGAVSRDGRGEIVAGIVMLLQGANTRTVVSELNEKIKELTPSLPEGMGVDVFYDRAELVDDTLVTIFKNLSEGALFVMGVLLILLGSIRGGLIVALVIPISLLFAFIGMRLLGLSGNLMSLGAIDFGIVVDGSIIVVENAMVHLMAALKKSGRPLSYKEASQVVFRSTMQVRKASIFGEMIIILIYIPILTLSGMEGKMFKPMGWTVLFALIGAFVTSLTLVPILAATFLRKHKNEKEPLLMRFFHRLYPPILDKTLHHPKTLLFCLVLLLGGMFALGKDMGAQFVPRLDEGALAVQVTRLPSVSLEESLDGARRLEEALLEFPEVLTVVSKTGRGEVATDPMGVELSDVHIELRKKSEWTSAKTTDELESLMAKVLSEELPGLKLSFSQPIELRVDELTSGVGSDVALTIYGDDLDLLGELSESALRILSQVKGATDLRASQLSGLPSLSVKPNRGALARLGMSGEDVLHTVEALPGKTVGRVYEGQSYFALQVRFPEHFRHDPGALGRLPVKSEGAPMVELSQVAHIDMEDSPVSIHRDGGRRRTFVEVNVRGRDIASFVGEAEMRIQDELKLPPGYTLSWGGKYENLEKAMGSLQVAVPMALLLIFMMLYLAFGNLKTTLIIYLNIPFSAAGGILFLWLRDLPFSISAAIGFITLFGVAVLNGVVLLAMIKEKRALGYSPMEAAREGALLRLRAVLTTAMVATLGFLPMALSTTAGAEVQRPLATVVIGGLLSTTLLTLLVLPTLYALLYKKEGELLQKQEG